jgi:putative transposase
MPNTYTRLYIHIVFAVKFRHNLINEEHREELQKFISGVVDKRNTKLIAIYCMPDHTHILIELKPTMILSDTVRDIKASSSKLINDRKWIRGRFEWQTGFGAFSCGYSQVDSVVKYIRNQKEHHHRNTFKQEYLDLLQRSEINYKEEYLFKWID